MSHFFIVDIRSEFRRNPYITFWRPKNANYAYPLPWAGRYLLSELTNVHFAKESGRLVRFPVVVQMLTDRDDTDDPLLISPEPGWIDGDVGPVIENTARSRRILRCMKFASTLKEAHLNAQVFQGDAG